MKSESHTLTQAIAIALDYMNKQRGIVGVTMDTVIGEVYVTKDGKAYEVAHAKRLGLTD